MGCPCCAQYCSLVICNCCWWMDAASAASSALRDSNLALRSALAWTFSECLSRAAFVGIIEWMARMKKREKRTLSITHSQKIYRVRAVRMLLHHEASEYESTFCLQAVALQLRGTGNTAALANVPGKAGGWAPRVDRILAGLPKCAVRIQGNFKRVDKKRDDGIKHMQYEHGRLAKHDEH